MELSGSNIFLKNSLYLRKRSFFIFQEIFMFLEVTFWVQKRKKKLTLKKYLVYPPMELCSHNLKKNLKINL